MEVAALHSSPLLVIVTITFVTIVIITITIVTIGIITITIVINVNDICNMKLLKVFIARQMLQ